jgi:agmatinase
MELGVDPYAELDIVDYGDIEVRPSDLQRSHVLLRRGVAEILAAGAIPIVLGGDHSLSTPVLQALAEHHGVDGFSVVHFDTHADTGSEVGEAPHGVPFHRAVIDGHLDGRNIVQLGLRGAWPWPEDFQWMREAGFRWHTIAEIVERGIGPVVNDAIEHARSRAPRTYLTVDIDVLDPAFAPGTGTPEAGGLTSRELLSVLRGLTGLHLVGADVVEVAPAYDHAEITSIAAATVVYDLLTLLARRSAH